MGVVQLKKINIDALTPIKVSSFEADLFHDDKYAYKIMREKVRISSEKIITLLEKENLKFLVKIIHLIKDNNEYIGYIMPYLKEYVALLSATSKMKLEKRVSVIKTIGEFFKQFSNKPYIYSDIHTNNIMINPNGRISSLKFIDIDSITLKLDNLFALDEDDYEEYFEIDMFKSSNLVDDYCCFDSSIDDFHEITKVFQDIATLSLTVLSDFDWQDVFNNNSPEYSLELLEKTYNDSKLTTFFKCLYCKNTDPLKPTYFSDNFSNFDINKIYQLHVKI